MGIKKTERITLILGVRRPLLLDLKPTRSGSCSPCSHKRGVGCPKLKKTTKTRIGGCSLGSLKRGVGRITTNEDWCLNMILLSIGVEYDSSSL